MDTVPERLHEVQHAIFERNDSRWPVEPCETLLFPRLADAIHIEFFGLPLDEAFENFIEVVRSADLAPRVASLVFRGPDEGSNARATGT